MLGDRVCFKCQLLKSASDFYATKKKGYCKRCCNAASVAHQKLFQQREAIPVPIAKTCTACHETKAASEFHANRGTGTGLLARCKSCYKAARAARIPKTAPATKLCTKCNQTKPGADFHPDARNASGIQSHCKACVNTRRVAHNTTPRGFQQKKQAEHRRRVSKRITPSDVTPEAWARLLEQFGNRCAYCLQPDNDLQIDHVEPLAKGGQHVISNIVPACIYCNGSKCDRTLLVCLMNPKLLVTQKMVG